MELAEINCEIFESRIELLRINQIIPKQSDLDEINTFGNKAINYYKQILKYAESEYEKSESESTIDDLCSIITVKLHVARLYSKLDFKDTKKKVNCMTVSLRIYEEVYNKLKKSSHTYSNQQLNENLMICEEMINLLPVKISKINQGLEI